MQAEEGRGTGRLCLFTSSHLRVDLSPDASILYAYWHGYQSFDTYVHGCNVMLELSRANRVEKILNDNSNVRGLWIGAAKWAARVWFPKIRDAGVKQFAWVYSRTVFPKSPRTPPWQKWTRLCLE